MALATSVLFSVLISEKNKLLVEKETTIKKGAGNIL
jgi:hypothetical protein